LRIGHRNDGDWFGRRFVHSITPPS
jgi:hypothetical protein